MSDAIRRITPVPAVAIVGWSGSGKTTLMEALISIFTHAGVKVGAIKHDAHEFNIDHEGKDSWRFSAAGAQRTVICSSTRVAMVEQLEQPVALDTLLQRFSPDLDLILVEGFKTESLPKIEVYRPALGHALLYGQEQRFQHVIAVATDAQQNDSRLSSTIPRLPLNEPSQIAGFIHREIISADRRKEV